MAAAVGELINNQLPIGRPGWPMGHTETGIRFSEGEHAVERLLAATSNLLDAGASNTTSIRNIGISLHQQVLLY